MKIILTILIISLFSYSCGDDRIYQKEMYKAKVKELELMKNKLIKKEEEINKKEKEYKYIKKGWELHRILVASQKIKSGYKLTSDMLSESVIPIKYMTANMLKVSNRGYFIGNTILRDIEQGDPLFESDFLKNDENINFSDMINKDGRAVSLELSEGDSVSNLIRPKNHIDLIWVYENPKNKKLISKVLLENVIVLAVGNYHLNNFKTKSKSKEIKYKSITMFLSLQEAQILSLAKKYGSISIALRNPDNAQKANTKEISLNDLTKDNELIDQLNKDKKETIEKTSIIKR